MSKNIVTKGDILGVYSDVRSKTRIREGIEKLESASIVPLTPSFTPAFIQVVRILRLRYSDGCIYRQKNNNSFTFYICFKEKMDALKLCEDIERSWNIKVTPCRGNRVFNVYLPAYIARLIIAMGSPVGDKTLKFLKLPEWVFELPQELKWEFIDGLFSGDGTAPKLKNSGYASESLKLSFNSEESVVEEFRECFMEDLWKLLNGLEIKVSKPKIKWKSKVVSKNGKITYLVVIRILTEKKNMINFLERIKYRYNTQASKQRKVVLKGLKGETLNEQLDLFLKSKGTFLPSPEISILLKKDVQRKLVDKAAFKVSQTNWGKYKKLAQTLYKTTRFKMAFSSLQDKYLPDWKNGKKFISLSYLKELVELTEWKIEYISKSIVKVKLCKNHNKFAVPVKL
ncbi:MAG: LAGLIDADG family homing endonuclease [Methanosarcinales archaeon]